MFKLCTYSLYTPWELCKATAGHSMFQWQLTRECVCVWVEGEVGERMEREIDEISVQGVRVARMVCTSSHCQNPVCVTFSRANHLRFLLCGQSLCRNEVFSHVPLLPVLRSLSVCVDRRDSVNIFSAVLRRNVTGLMWYRRQGLGRCAPLP